MNDCCNSCISFPLNWNTVKVVESSRCEVSWKNRYSNITKLYVHFFIINTFKITLEKIQYISIFSFSCTSFVRVS